MNLATVSLNLNPSKTSFPYNSSTKSAAAVSDVELFSAKISRSISSSSIRTNVSKTESIKYEWVILSERKCRKDCNVA